MAIAPTASRQARAGPVVAAAVAVVVVVLWLLWPRPSTTLPTGPVPADGAALPVPPSQFVWPDRSGSGTRRVEVYDDAGKLVWESPPLTGPPAVTPPDVMFRMSGGGAYTWQVRRYDDAEPASGPLRRFTVARGGPF